jgi:hypothetical protein
MLILVALLAGCVPTAKRTLVSNVVMAFPAKQGRTEDDVVTLRRLARGYADRLACRLALNGENVVKIAVIAKALEGRWCCIPMQEFLYPSAFGIASGREHMRGRKPMNPMKEFHADNEVEATLMPTGIELSRSARNARRQTYEISVRVAMHPSEAPEMTLDVFDAATAGWLRQSSAECREPFPPPIPEDRSGVAFRPL